MIANVSTTPSARFENSSKLEKASMTMYRPTSAVKQTTYALKYAL